MPNLCKAICKKGMQTRIAHLVFHDKYFMFMLEPLDAVIEGRNVTA